MRRILVPPLPPPAGAATFPDPALSARTPELKTVIPVCFADEAAHDVPVGQPAPGDKPVGELVCDASSRTEGMSLSQCDGVTSQSRRMVIRRRSRTSLATRTGVLVWAISNGPTSEPSAEEAGSDEPEAVTVLPSELGAPVLAVLHRMPVWSFVGVDLGPRLPVSSWKLRCLYRVVATVLTFSSLVLAALFFVVFELCVLAVRAVAALMGRQPSAVLGILKQVLPGVHPKRRDL
jgi:hypothetical protein